ncbi:MAG: caspase family protein [Anaerolineales bacterium]|nr:caspase family protein [Anaerolineales bacterium]
MAGRLLALVVGIDDYAGGAVPALRGAIADAAAVHALLVRQLGAAPADAVLLTGAAATRQGILDAWRSHLIAQAGQDDQIFFHFSGHGSQTPSIDPDEADGLDETLVAYDSRATGGNDILDKELAWLIDEAEQRGAQVSIVLDCCHAGSGTRSRAQAAVRLTTPRPDRPDPQKLVAPEEALLRAASTPTRHIVLAAAHDFELANEYFAAEENTWRGAVTYFFVEALRMYLPELTWSGAYDYVATRVHALYPRQSPLLGGDGAMRVFGAGVKRTAGYLRVTAQLAPDKIQVDGGATIGLNPSAELAVFTPSSDLKGTPRATGTVTAVDPATAEARLNREMTVELGSRVQILSYGFAGQAHTVAVAALEVAAAIGVARAGKPSPLLRVVDESDGAPEFFVRTTSAGYQIEDAAGAHAGGALPTTPDGAAEIVRMLEHLAIFRNVQALQNPRASLSLRNAIQLVTEGAAPAKVGGSDARPALRLRLQNVSGSRVFVVVFRLAPDYSITKVKPDDGFTLTVEPGRAAAAPITLTAPALDEAAEGRVAYKFFVLGQSMNLNVLELPPLGGDPLAGAAARANSPLADLLEGVRRSGTLPIRPAAASRDELWHTFTVEFPSTHS